MDCRGGEGPSSDAINRVARSYAPLYGILRLDTVKELSCFLYTRRTT